ncbi:DNA mismatch repair protein MutS [Candidatus Parcubacteria bacterium]|nr:MAG: DNA mismatch repair protein MutS [Candidatus Parcubacteria bacterium]
MKVFLMYPDRDFDPNQALPSNVEDMTQDLELNVLFEAMALGDDFLWQAVRHAVLSRLDSPDLIYYRQGILQDCLRYPDVIRQIYSIPLQFLERKRKHWLGIFSSYSSPNTILSSGRELLDMSVDLLKELKRIADTNIDKFESTGFRRFFAMIQEELDDDYFAVVENHLKALKFRGGVLLSAELGPGNEGVNYVLRKPNHQKQNWIRRIFSKTSPTYSFTLHPRDEHGARVLSELRDKGLNRVADAVARSAEHIESFFNALRIELAFYLGCLNLSQQLAHLEEPIAFPTPASPEERRFSCRGLYDVTLALTMKQKVVGNDISAHGKGLVIITGANQGGKSTFLRSVGLAQLMMQCGMFVPAESFSANVCRGLFTHYKREEDALMESGKFDEEMGRMSAIVDAISPNALILFNESFAATNEREGSEIARQIVNALLEKGVKVFFVTHLYEFARQFYTRKMEQALFLRAERLPDGTRTFKIVEGAPQPTSHGVDVYNKIFETGQ